MTHTFSCAMGGVTLSLGAGATVVNGTTGEVGETSHFTTTMGGSAPDDLYVLQLASAMVVSISDCPSSPTWTRCVSVRNVCDIVQTEGLSCGSNGSSITNLYLPAGTYYMIVDGMYNASDMGAYSFNITAVLCTPTVT
jgi:hypothetical protein